MPPCFFLPRFSRGFFPPPSFFSFLTQFFLFSCPPFPALTFSCSSILVFAPPAPLVSTKIASAFGIFAASNVMVPEFSRRRPERFHPPERTPGLLLPVANVLYSLQQPALMIHFPCFSSGSRVCCPRSLSPLCVSPLSHSQFLVLLVKMFFISTHLLRKTRPPKPSFFFLPPWRYFRVLFLGGNLATSFFLCDML